MISAPFRARTLAAIVVLVLAGASHAFVPADPASLVEERRSLGCDLCEATPWGTTILPDGTVADRACRQPSETRGRRVAGAPCGAGRFVGGPCDRPKTQRHPEGCLSKSSKPGARRCLPKTP